MTDEVIMKRREQMSINRWMLGCLPCAIYNSGSVGVYCQTLGCFSISAHTHTHTHTQTQTKPTVTYKCFLLIFTPLSVGFKLYSSSPIQWSWYLPRVLAPVCVWAHRTHRTTRRSRTCAGTCLSTQPWFMYGEGEHVSCTVNFPALHGLVVKFPSLL